MGIIGEYAPRVAARWEHLDRCDAEDGHALRDRFGNRRERGGGLFNHLTVVADDAPPPVRVTGSLDSKHVHLDDLDAQDNSSERM